ncbi:MAG: NADH-quinone oxidoreductase subunit 5 family protein [Acidimicrobiales bacterium]
MNAWVIPAITFASFWLILFLGKRLPKGGVEIGVGAVAVAFVLSVVSVAQWVDRPATEVVEPAAATAGEAHDGAGVSAGEGRRGVEAGEAEQMGAGAEGEGGQEEPIREAVRRTATWWRIGDVEVTVGTHVDGFTVVMLFVVTTISLLVHVFSTSYMLGDVRVTYFFAGLSLFTSGMLLLVVASSTLLLLFGWEVMGLCSFMLIGHWWEKRENSDAAVKAFLTTRIGDAGLLVGIVIMFFAAGQTFDIAEINERVLGGQVGETVLLVGAAALLVGVIGKSAQFPLHTWLPDAMAGPTPVSALIHAATMVVAGVYLTARLYGVFWEGFDISAGGANPVAVIGGVTLLIAAALAFVQADIKKVLAYSTVSQLGYMVMALGVGAWTAGIFHLFTHAFFKALLFLGAGSVSHAVHGFDMKADMGGLRRTMPVTYATFLTGSLALAGLFPLAGFWSKDEILLGAGEGGYQLFAVVGLVGAALTAAYMARCVYLTFFGEYRGHGHPHESPPAITVPLVVLAAFSAGAGLLNAPGFEGFARITENRVFLLAGIEEHAFEVGPAVLSTLFVLVGLVAGGLAYFGGRLPEGLTARSPLAGAGYRLLANKYYLDHLYTGVVVGSIKGSVARGAYWVNQKVIDGAVNAVGIMARRSGSWVYRHIDQEIVDGAVNGVGFGAEDMGGILRTIQTGRVQQYGALLFGAATVLALGLVVLT